MKSIGTEFRVNRRTRGVAEIELVFVIIFVLLPMLFLIGGAWTIGRERVRAVYDSENGAYAQVISGVNVTTYADDPIPPEGLIGIRPGLPNRYDSQRVSGTASLDYGSMGRNIVSYSERAIFLDPTYHWSAFPYSPAGDADHAMLAEWFADYASEAKTPVFAESLGLDAPGPP